MTNIDDVQAFWDKEPLGAGYVRGELGTRGWFEEFDRLKTNYGLVGSLDLFMPADPKGCRTLDVGCGPGYWARTMIPRGIQYTGIDISPRSAAIARESMRLFGLNGTVEVGNAEKLPFPDGAFDHVVSEGVIHHTPDTASCAREIWRVLRPGGTAAVSVYYRSLALRNGPLFSAAKLTMRLTRVMLKGRGRETITSASSPDDFVRMYDGADNPIGKAYTGPDVQQLFGMFSTIELHRYFMPYYGPLIVLPPAIRKSIASHFGLMILARVTK